MLLLSRREVDLHVQGQSQCTPLWHATECGNLDAARLLIMHGANPSVPDVHRITPLNNAILQRVERNEGSTSYAQDGDRNQRRQSDSQIYLSNTGGKDYICTQIMVVCDISDMIYPIWAR